MFGSQRDFDNRSVLVALNTSRRTQAIDVPISSFKTSAEDLLNSNRVMVSGNTIKVTLPAQSGAFIG